MKNNFFICFLTIICITIFANLPIKAQKTDAEGCQDYPLFQRKAGYRMETCIIKDADTVAFPIENRISQDMKMQTVMGNSSFYWYIASADSARIPALIMFRNFEDSLRKHRGYVVARAIEIGNPGSFITGKIEKENVTIWMLIQASNNDYMLTVVEKQRKINVLSAENIWNILDSRDSVTVDIFFDDDTTTIIPASYPVIDQVHEMLVRHPLVKVSIQAHTDNTPGPRNSKILAAERAKVVLDVLTAKGIEKNRLKSCGWGWDKPVADNRTEEGRTKNRRLVLVRISD